MLRLSDNSQKKVMLIINNKKDTKTICNLRRSCFQMNKVAIQNGFNKMKATYFSLNLPFNYTYPYVQRDWKRSLLVQKVFIGKQPKEANEIIEGLVGYRKRLPKYSYAFKYYRVYPSTDIHHLVKNAFEDSQIKVTSINELKLTGITLDSGILQILEEYAFSYRTCAKIEIQQCKIEWTEADLMKFLQLFEGLKDVRISGKFSEPIVTDQHLSLLCGNISIISEGGDTFHFPGITSRICGHLFSNKIKCLTLINISTEISFSDIQKFTTPLNKKVLKKEQKTYINGRRLNFGALKYSKNEYHNILLAQRERNAEWKIRKYSNTVDWFVVYPEYGSHNYEFTMKRPYEEPDFTKLLEELNEMRAEAEAGEFIDLRNQGLFEDQLDIISIKLTDYQRKHKLAAVPFQNNQQENIQLDEDDDFQLWRQDILGDINRYEHIIRHRMEQMNAQVEE